MLPELEKKIREIINDEISKNFYKNYWSGAPQIAPHSHNGVDNLPVNSNDIVGNLVKSIIAGTNVTVSPSTGIGDVTINASGGGGSPGGSDRTIQYNNSGAFGGDDRLTFHPLTQPDITFDDGTVDPLTGGGIITGGTSSINLLTNSNSADDDVTGSIFIEAGVESGANGVAGGVNIYAGSATKNSGTPGSIIIHSGDSGDGIGGGTKNGGDVELSAGFAGNAVVGGNINIISGGGGTAGTIFLSIGGGTTKAFVHIRDLTAGAATHPNVGFSTSTPTFGGGQGVIYIHNRTTTPSSNPTNGGILYVNAGALHWLGSGGTDTTIAPA